MFCPTQTGECCRYWDLGDKLIANNSRVGSVSVFTALRSKFPSAQGVMVPTKPVFMLVREPVDRFVSAKRKSEIHPGTGNHFDLQSDLAIGPKVFLYRFPEELEKFGRDTGIGKIPWINKSPTDTPELSNADREEVLKRYAPDVTLFNSIK